MAELAWIATARRWSQPSLLSLLQAETESRGFQSAHAANAGQNEPEVPSHWS